MHYQVVLGCSVPWSNERPLENKELNAIIGACALIGILDQNVVPLVSLTTTKKEMWDTLADAFASTSRGHIKQLKTRLKNITKGPQFVTEYMNAIKVFTNPLALLGAKVDQEDITDRVLEGLDDSYQGIIDTVNARDKPVLFFELHEKLINRELTIKNQPILGTLPATTNPTISRHTYSSSQRQPTQHTNSYQSNQNSSSHNINSSSFTGTKLFLGKCQWCHTKGYSLKKCPIFPEKYPGICPPPPPTYRSHPPQAHVATSTSPQSSQWPLDYGASLHVTHDLANLSLHHLYSVLEI
ncbi:retrovirus-related pol polyprotein from transposon RE1 [Tanacetum coccineum]